MAVGVGGYEDADIDKVLSRILQHRHRLMLIYGYQAFPTPLADTCLDRISYLVAKYRLPVGFADHVDAGNDLALRLPEYAVCAGAAFIEKHITLDRSSKGYDYYSSLEPDRFSEMVQGIRQCVEALGSNRVTKGQKDYLQHAVRATTTRLSRLPRERSEPLSVRVSGGKPYEH